MHPDNPRPHSRRSLAIFLFSIILLTLQVHVFAQNGILDRIVAVVDNQIITLGDMRLEKTMREVLGERPPQNDRELLDEIIDQRLIRAQLQLYPNTQSTEAEVDEELSQIKDHKGLPLDEVREAVRDRLRVQQFFTETFGRVITIKDAEIQKYYDEVFVPAASARGLTSIPPLATVMGEVRESIFQQKLAAEVKQWLERVKRNAKIQIFD